ncbi:type II secretion system minor pseudopilin GspH [Colwelliaceae bacterium 6441]
MPIMGQHNCKHKDKGFTLIEVLLVIVVIGLMVAAIQVNFSSNKPEATLEQEAKRFAGVFNLAAEYGLLNNLELGLYLDDNTYQFVGYDGLKWQPLPDNDLLSTYELPENIQTKIIFDDLPIDEASLIDAELFTPDDESLEEMKEGLSDDEKPLIPHVYILSGGEITPFRVEFAFNQAIYDSSDVMFAVTGLYSTPINVSGPFLDGVYVETNNGD